MFRLALSLGITVADLLENVGSGELTEWMAYYTIEPFGPVRDDDRAGVIAATVVNMHRPKGRGMKPADFFPRKKKPQTPDQMLAVFKAMSGALQHGVDRRDN